MKFLTNPARTTNQDHGETEEISIPENTEVSVTNFAWRAVGDEGGGVYVCVSLYACVCVCNVTLEREAVVKHLCHCFPRSETPESKCKAGLPLPEPCLGQTY